MSPPDVNLKKQRRRHWPVFWGILAAVVLAVLGWIGFGLFLDRVDVADEGASGGATTDAPASSEY